MRKVLVGFIFFMSFTFFDAFAGAVVHAADHRIEDIHMAVFIDDDGTAHIKETRLVDFLDGTENYIVFSNLGNSSIKNFTVTEDGQLYESVDHWDLDASREEKAFKSGMIETADGIELSWGIGEYGPHEYIIEYEVTNFIKQLNDAQMLYWQFVNPDMDPAPENVRIDIEASKAFTNTNTQLWTFGHHGTFELLNGKIHTATNRPMTADNYVLILSRFANGMFQTEDVIDQNFREIQEEAFVGSDYEIDDELDEEIADKKDAIVVSKQNQAETPKREKNKYDDDEEDYNFGYYIREAIAAVFNFFSSIFD